MLARGCAWQPEWREVVLLLAGLLHQQKVERVIALFSAALDTLGGNTLGRLLNLFTGQVPLVRQGVSVCWALCCSIWSR